MTEHKTMNTVVHAAFRRDLNRFDRSLASFPAGSRHRADQLNRVWAFFENELHQHHHYEEDVDEHGGAVCLTPERQERYRARWSRCCRG